jgi:hypothetical protein
MSNIKNIKNIKNRATAQGKATTCWFHAALNPFLITPRARRIMGMVIRAYKSSLNSRQQHIVPFENFRNTFYMTKPTHEQLTFNFWKAINILLNKDLYEGEILKTTAKCSGALVKGLVPNFKERHNLNVVSIPDRLLNPMLQLLQWNVGLYEDLENKHPTVKNPVMLFRTKIYRLTNLSRLFKGTLLDHAIIRIEAHKPILINGRKISRNHLICGIIYNGKQYIIDSAGPEGEAYVAQCDWATNINNIKNDVYLWEKGYDNPKTLQYEYSCYIKPEL